MTEGEDNRPLSPMTGNLSVVSLIDKKMHLSV